MSQIQLQQGGDASNYAQYVYGDMDQQRAVSDQSNRIAAVHDPAGYTGGRKVKNKGMMIPTVFLVANTNCKPSRKSRKLRRGGKSRKSKRVSKSRKSRKSRK